MSAKVYDQEEHVYPSYTHKLANALYLWVIVIAVVFIAVSIGYHEYDAAFWTSVGWIVAAMLNALRRS